MVKGNRLYFFFWSYFVLKFGIGKDVCVDNVCKDELDYDC